MNTEERRKRLLELLKLDIKPVSASNLAEHFQVSRQIIVGDIALLRAAGEDITATPRGYVLNKAAKAGAEDDVDPDTYVIAANHGKAELENELYIIVDNGGSLLNVSVEHPVYGAITQGLDIKSRYDADKFLSTIMSTGASLLCDLTDGVHLHTVRCPDVESYRRILMKMKEAGLLNA